MALLGCSEDNESVAETPSEQPETEVPSDQPETEVPSDQPGAEFPFDLSKFEPVLTQCRLHSPSTSPAAVSRGNFRGYELPGRFYVGESGTTMVLATTDDGRDRSELRHNFSWLVTEQEITYSARMRFDKPVALGGERSRLHVLQIYTTGGTKGPMVLVTWAGSWGPDGEEDSLTAYVRGSTTHDLGPRPDGFFNLDVWVKQGVVRIYIDNELKVEDDVSAFAGSNAYFKTGAYHRGIEPAAVEFDSLSITVGPPTELMVDVSAHHTNSSL